MHFGRNPFMCSCKGVSKLVFYTQSTGTVISGRLRRGVGGGCLNEFRFGIFIGHFLTDGVAGAALKGLSVVSFH